MMLRVLRLKWALSHVRGLHSCAVVRSSQVAGLSIVNTDRYPIHDLRSTAGKAMLEKAHQQLNNTGCASFPEFLNTEALADMAEEATGLAPQAYVTDATHNAYQLPFDDDYPHNHVRNLQMSTRVASNSFADLTSTSRLRHLYEWSVLAAFVGAVTARPCFPLADPLGCCSINVFRPGWEHAFHFDEAEFTTTLCLQQSGSGGEFEFTPPLRQSDKDLAVESVSAVLNTYSTYRPDSEAGDCPALHTAPFEPGTLQVFAGRYCLHRVKNNTAKTANRLVAVLCFASEPGVINSPEVQQMFWGRTLSPE